MQELNLDQLAQVGGGTSIIWNIDIGDYVIRRKVGKRIVVT